MSTVQKAIICLVCPRTFKENAGHKFLATFHCFLGLHSLFKKFVPCFSLKLRGQTRQIMAFWTVFTKAHFMMYMMSKTIMYLICACDINDHVIPYPKYTTIIKPGQLVNAYNLMRVHVCTMISLI